jgi:dTDP-4-dehydrorhamnose reductase
MSAAGQTTWFEFAKKILEEAKANSRDLRWLADATKGRQLIAQRLTPVSTEEFGSPARRPAYSVLSNSHLTQSFGLALPDWRSQLQRCFLPDQTAADMAASSL